MEMLIAVVSVHGNGGDKQDWRGFAYTVLCLLDFESSASFLQVNQNDILKLIFGVTSFIYYLFEEEAICLIFVLLMYLLGPSKSSEGLITPLLSLHHVPFHSLAYAAPGMFFSTFHMMTLYVCIWMMDLPAGPPRKVVWVLGLMADGLG